MLGAIIGDIVGSRFEWSNCKSKEFELFTGECRPTDDSIMSLAVADALMQSDTRYANLSELTIEYMQKLGRLYPDAGYGGMFKIWLYSDDPKPYKSYGNGSAMRVSPCGFAATTLEEARRLSDLVSSVTHNHPEGMKGAEAVAVAIFMARHGASVREIRSVIEREYYNIDFSIDDIRDTYEFNETCQGSVPQALAAFFESSGFEDAIRNAISVGGDSDTIAAMTGGIAEAYYGIPDDIRTCAITYLDERLRGILADFEKEYM